MILISMTDANYSTRRIRRQVWGQDLKSVQEKQITIPVNVPFSLENFLLTTLPQDFDDLPSGFTNFKPLIPVHDSSKYLRSTAVLPSLRDTAAENGNLRYWVITNENMWASQHRVLDEFAEVMWSLFHWFTQAMTSASAAADVTTLEDISTSCWRLARSFRRRIVLPEVTCTRVNSATTRSDLPSLRESLLFRPWALTSPAKPDREHTQHLSERDELFDEECVLYPFPDDFFWDPSDEGTWGEDGVPEWAEAPLEKVAENEKEQGIYSQKNKRNSKRI